MLPVVVLQTWLHDRSVSPYSDSGPTGLSEADRKQSQFHLPVKTFVKGPNYYGLYYKCVSKHFIINWNLAS